MRWGIVGAYGFRIAIVFAAVWLVEYPPARFLGACYLLWLAWQHFRGEEEGPAQDITRQANFWQTLVMVELTDLVFSFDSIAASVAVSRKAWVIILGGILGITLMRYMASLFLRWLDEFSRLEDAAFAIIALVGSLMLLEVFFPRSRSRTGEWWWLCSLCLSGASPSAAVLLPSRGPARFGSAPFNRGGPCRLSRSC